MGFWKKNCESKTRTSRRSEESDVLFLGRVAQQEGAVLAVLQQPLGLVPVHLPPVERAARDVQQVGHQAVQVVHLFVDCQKEIASWTLVTQSWDPWREFLIGNGRGRDLERLKRKTTKRRTGTAFKRARHYVVLRESQGFRAVLSRKHLEVYGKRFPWNQILNTTMEISTRQTVECDKQWQIISNLAYGFK